MIKHEKIEKNSGLLLVFIFIIISIGGLIEIVPLFFINDTIEEVKKEITVDKVDADGKVVLNKRGRPEKAKKLVDAIRPYTPLELVGRNIYVSEGCYNCHSQQIRPLQDDFMRYGHYSLAAESQYDRPFQWGSRRMGPDLARVGGKYSNRWHVDHLVDPKSQVPESIMPRYSWLTKKDVYYKDIKAHMKALRLTGVPYSLTADEYKANVNRFGVDVANMLVIDAIDVDGEPLMTDLRDEKGAYVKENGRNKRVPLDAIVNFENQARVGQYDVTSEGISQMDALVSYLQMLGTMYQFKQDQGIEFSEFR